MSNFEQFRSATERKAIMERCAQHGGQLMPKTDQFWQYAKEAILSASYAKTDDERLDLLDLARTWTQAALVERHLLADYDGPTIAA